MKHESAIITALTGTGLLCTRQAAAAHLRLCDGGNVDRLLDRHGVAAITLARSRRRLYYWPHVRSVVTDGQKRDVGSAGLFLDAHEAAEPRRMPEWLYSLIMAVLTVAVVAWGALVCSWLYAGCVHLAEVAP